MKIRTFMGSACAIAMAVVGTTAANATALTYTFENLAPEDGFLFTPVYLVNHDGTFDLFDVGAAIPDVFAEFESIVEDGAIGPARDARLAAHPDSQGGVIFGADIPPIMAGETASTTLDVNGAVNRFFTFGTMLIPSQDAFIGLDDPLAIFDEDGNFNGRVELLFFPADIYDGGTEANSDNSAIAFLNQSAPNTGETEGGVVRQHEGLNDFILDSMFIGPGGAIPFSRASADFTQAGFGPVARLTIDVAATEVPAPAALGLLGLGLSGLALRRRRT